MNLARSEQLQQRARQRIPGGVNSPVRAFGAVGGTPPWLERGEGAFVIDVDGNRYLDFICSWGALIHGHAPPAVVAATQRAAANGSSFGAPTPDELRLADAIHGAMPHVEMLRFVNSGTEAVMSAIRLARAFTGRERVLKFAGCYHGHADALLVQAGSGLATLALPSSAGVSATAVAQTINVPYNDVAGVETAFRKYRGAIAAVIVEPVAGNMGCVPPEPGFLECLRELTRQDGALLILDEVITGFRLGAGAAARFEMQPDLVTLGKIIGGGLPVGAYGGRADIMRWVAPLGPVYQAGTLSGNPLAMAAGLAALEPLLDSGALTRYAALEARAAALADGLNRAIAERALPACVQRCGSMFTLFFAAGPIRNFDDAQACDTAAFARFHAAMLRAGVMLPPSQFETAFLSLSHGDAEVARFLECARAALRIAAP